MDVGGVVGVSSRAMCDAITRIMSSAGGITFAGYPGDQTGPQKELIDYWVHGKGAAEIGWDAEGGFARCVEKLGPKVAGKVSSVQGLCANLHKAATGKWPSEHRGN